MESNCDFLSSGERTGKSLNRTGVTACERCLSGVVGSTVYRHSGAEELQSWVLAELAWKGRPQKVIAL